MRLLGRPYNLIGVSRGGAPGVLGIWGEWLFIFRDLGSTGNYIKEVSLGASSKFWGFWEKK